MNNLEIKEKWFYQILNFKDAFTNIKFDDFREYRKINVKVLLSFDLYDYFRNKIILIFKTDNPFTIMDGLGFGDHPGLHFPEQGFLQLYEQIEEEPMSMFIEVYNDKKLVSTYCNHYYE